MVYLFALLIGVVAGLRAMTAPAAVAWAAHLGWIRLAGSWLGFMGSAWAAGIFLFLAIGELVGDQLKSTPSRKVPVQFGTRLLMGALTGAAIGIAGGLPSTIGALLPATLCGIGGAGLGTWYGAAARAKLAAMFGSDRPAALIEDVVAIGGALLIVTSL